MAESRTLPEPDRLESAVERRTAALYEQHQQNVFRRADRLFAGLMVFQWLAGIGVAFWLSPRTWAGAASATHPHVWLALLLGAAIYSFPVGLALARPGARMTRHVIAVGQMLGSALLIHLTGGRIETHFHVFGSLAFLAFYRDWPVLLTATVVVGADHFLRGVFWPQSVFGVLTASPWRWVEHAGWVAFENLFLVLSCFQGIRDNREVCEKRARLEATNELVEHKVQERTAELKQAQEALRTVVMNAPVVLFAMDRDGIFTLSEGRGLAALGLRPGQVVGRSVWEVYREFPAVLGPIRRAFTGEALTSVSEIGETVFETRLSPILDADGRVCGVTGVATDITERKQSEAALRESEELYHSTFEQAAVGMAHVAPNGILLRANQRLCEILGYSSTELLARSLTDLLHPEDAADPAVRRVLAGEAPGSACEVRHLRQDGSPVWVNLNVSLLRDGEGTARHFLHAIQDITDRRTLEQQFRQAQKMEAVGRLAGGIAHDFNNMLAVINGYTELLLLDPDSPGREDLVEIHQAGLRAAALTRQLLAFSRRQMLQMQVLDLTTVVRGVETMLRRLIGEDVELVTVSSGSHFLVKADPGQMEQVIVNLAVNARNAMPQGGKLTIETKRVRLDESYAERHSGVVPGRYVMLVVSDTGCGMDAETQARIFEPFFTTRDPGKGTGLGLATVYAIVQQSGGHIWVYSEPGHGTTFKVYLPQVEAPEEQAMEPASSPAPASGSETVLVVEDEPGVRALVRRMLERSGYYVLEAEQPDEVAPLCQKHAGRIDLLLTDVVMPGASGRELAERVSALHPEIGVLYMSGYTDDAIVRHGVLAADMPFIEKPFTADNLARKVREVLESRAPLPRLPAGSPAGRA